MMKSIFFVLTLLFVVENLQNSYVLKASPIPINSLENRNFLQGGYAKPVILLNTAQETIASNEAATTNQLQIQAANAAQCSNTFDHEAAETFLLNKRAFLGQYKPVILVNTAQETIASNEAATTNQLQIQAANAAQCSNTFDHEAAETFLFN